MKPPKIPPSAAKLLAPLAAAAAESGLPLYVVGGPVRDWILGRNVFDFDLCCEGDPAPLAKLAAEKLEGKAESFGQFNTWRVIGKTLRFDLAMCRRETYPQSAALPLVSPAPIRDDLRRRDFTVNAMAMRLLPGGSGELIDPFHGLADLRAKVLRELHGQSFRDDPTRVFRAARYACRFGLTPTPALLAQAKAALAQGFAAKLSRHRVAQEFLRILHEKDCAAPLELVRQWGYLALVHRGLQLPPVSLTGAWERLAAMAVLLGKDEGMKFMAGLPVDRGITTQIREMLDITDAKASPRAPLSPLAKKVLTAVHPKLPDAALKPVLVNGRDLQALGLQPGRRFKEILDEAATLQWSGNLRSRVQALQWLKAAARTGGR